MNVFAYTSSGCCVFPAASGYRFPFPSDVSTEIFIVRYCVPASCPMSRSHAFICSCVMSSPLHTSDVSVFVGFPSDLNEADDVPVIILSSPSVLAVLSDV